MKNPLIKIIFMVTFVLIIFTDTQNKQQINTSNGQASSANEKMKQENESTIHQQINGNENDEIPTDPDDQVYQSSQEEEVDEEVDEDQINEIYDDQQRDMLQFSQHMGNFIPDQTFTFKLGPEESNKLILWPGENVIQIRGLFHSEMQSDDIDGYVHLQIYENENLYRNYNNQRLGIFNINHNIKNNQYFFIFKSTGNMEVYFSYEYMTSKKKNAQNNQSTFSPNQQLNKVTAKFQKINQVTVQQEAEMTRIMHLSKKHSERIERDIKNSHIRIISQTVIIIIGGCFCLWLLKQQVYEGYKLLV